jgi:hypothetical protein
MEPKLISYMYGLQIIEDEGRSLRNRFLIFEVGISLSYIWLLLVFSYQLFYDFWMLSFCVELHNLT